MKLDQIIARGNAVGDEIENPPSNFIECSDGFQLSVIAGYGTYCLPRPWRRGQDLGPYHAVEVGFPTSRPEPWGAWHAYCESPRNPTGTVYGFVPHAMVRALITLHGGEKEEES